MTSPDNVLAYRFLSANPLGRNLPVEVLAGIGLARANDNGTAGWLIRQQSVKLAVRLRGIKRCLEQRV